LESNNAKIELSHERAERFYLRLSLGTLLGLLLLIAILWAGHGLYVRWQERRLIQRATFAMDHADDRTASLAARNVLELKPASAPAARIVAELAEKAGNRAALDWRRRVVDLQPNSVEDELAWAKCALQFNNVSTAQRALSSIPEAGRQNAGYHAVAALLAQARGREDQADSEWTQAKQLAPGEKNYQLQLGILLLRANNGDRHASGQAMLTELLDNPKLRAPATRALINDEVLRRENPQHALQLASELQSYPEATFSDRLLFLSVLRQAEDPRFIAYLTDLEKSTLDDPVNLAALLTWMSQNNLNLLALDFVKRVPADKVGKWPVPLTVAEVFARLKDWRSLEAATNSANWGQFDYLRHAYLARALREQDQAAAAEHEWSSAIKAAATDDEYVLALARTAAEWNWHKEAVELLWQLSKNADTQSEALHTLYLHYANAKDTRGLYRVLLRLFEMDPTDLKVQNNLAQVCLLLDADRGRARKLAADLYRKERSNAAFAATYAFSLYVVGDTAGAVKTMAGLSEEQLRDPSVAAYEGLFLAAAGDSARAKQFLDVGATANLLPEELALVKKAQREVAAR
jgi:Flp pilus assembly protein TadD